MIESSPAAGPRADIERALAIVRRIGRHLPAAAAVAILGTGLAVALAFTHAHEYKSETVLLYREMISESILQGRDVTRSSRNLATRYREILLARSTLGRVIEDLHLFPDIVADEGLGAAILELKGRLSFKDRGGGTFHIAFNGPTPEIAQKVTAKLASVLISEDNRIRRQQALRTSEFLIAEKNSAIQTLKMQEKALAQFLVEHPEFAEVSASGQQAGASIRAQKGGSGLQSGDSRLNALERQRQRLRARLANPDEPVRTRSPERIQAEAETARLRQEVREAEAHLRNILARVTARHPDAIAADAAVKAAEARLRQARASMPAMTVAPPVDRAKLEAELRRISRDISNLRSGHNTTVKVDPGESWVVALETEWARLQREVEEARERVGALDARAFAAEIKASSELASQAQLMVIDEAYLPAEPAGRGRRFFAMAGAVAFAGLGLFLALGLAVIDDRIDSRRDLERLGIAPVFSEVPKRKRKRRR